MYHIGLIGMVDVVLNFYFVSLGYGSETIGLLQSLPRLAGLLASLPIGLLANRIGARKVMILGTVGSAFSFLVLVIWPVLPMLGLARFLLGLFYGMVQIASIPMLMSLSDAQHKTHLFAYNNLTSLVGTALGSAIGGSIPLLVVTLFPMAVQATDLPPAQTPFAYGAALGLAGFLTLLSTLPLMKLEITDEDRMLRARTEKPKPSVTPWFYLIILSMPLLLFGFTGGLTFPFYNLFFRTVYTVPDQLIGTIFSFGWMSMAILPMANPWFERRFGRAGTLGLMMGIAGFAFLGLSVAPTLGIAVIAYIVAISCRNVMQPLFQPLIMDVLKPSLHNIASSIGTVLWNIGWFTATAISGFWQSTYGFGFIMQVVAVGVFMTGASIAILYHNRPPYQGEEASA